MKELKPHIVSGLCLIVLFLLPLFFDANPFWLISVILLILLMVLRSFLGEISKSNETIFTAFYLLILKKLKQKRRKEV